MNKKTLGMVASGLVWILGCTPSVFYGKSYDGFDLNGDHKADRITLTPADQLFGDCYFGLFVEFYNKDKRVYEEPMLLQKIRAWEMSLPQIVDIDTDGDLDILFENVNGARNSGYSGLHKLIARNDGKGNFKFQFTKK